MTNELNPKPQKADALTNKPGGQPTPKPEKRPNAKPLPDWRPLGSVRDYFTELMKQDDFR